MSTKRSENGAGEAAVKRSKVARQEPPRVASRETWLEERKELLMLEKEALRKLDSVAEKLRELPAVLVKKEYTFVNVDSGTTIDLKGLFVDDKKDCLVVQHFMHDPDWDAGCKSCSLMSDSINGVLSHLQQKANFACVSRAPAELAKKFKSKKEWNFPMYSSYDSTFNYDFGVSFTQEEVDNKEKLYNYGNTVFCKEAPGVSVFRKVVSSNGDEHIYHTYSTFARGLERFMSVYPVLDILPRGREENPKATMDWVQHKESY
mmetsp:Transcript_7229/g.8288  ORF Transcript_7229/g.8288 Transcript_7229/m.8288 type:complete len:261 (+) Transcript_7229:77-859(+)